jgi:abortive infection bacteriophage resistance protein
MAQESTILIDKKVIELLKEAKDHPKQTYNELLERMAKLFIVLKKRNQYDEFLHKIQQPKMKELWGNKEDEVWDEI